MEFNQDIRFVGQLILVEIFEKQRLKLVLIIIVQINYMFYLVHIPVFICNYSPIPFIIVLNFFHGILHISI